MEGTEIPTLQQQGEGSEEPPPTPSPLPGTVEPFTEETHLVNAECSAESIKSRKRNLAAFWFLGLLNTVPFHIITSAAMDLLTESTVNMTTLLSLEPPDGNTTSTVHPSCVIQGTGKILLAGFLPVLIAKMFTPLLLRKLSYNVWVFAVVVMQCFGLVAAGFGYHTWMRIIGVVSVSAAQGIGENVFICMATYCERRTVCLWASGSAFAGFLAHFLYEVLTAAGLSPETVCVVLLLTPLCLTFTYIDLMDRPIEVHLGPSGCMHGLSKSDEILYDLANKKERPTLLLREQVLLLVPLLNYTAPMAFIYLASFFIRQGLGEHIIFWEAFIPVLQQTLWYEIFYSIGVFIAATSGIWLHIRNINIFTVLQYVNLLLFLLQLLTEAVPYVWVLLLAMVYVGLLAGWAYVNVFNTIVTDVPLHEQEWSIGMTVLANTIGVGLAGIISVPVHNAICRRFDNQIHP